MNKRRKLPNNPVSLDRNFHRALTALRATISRVGSPRTEARMPNSNKRVPAPAVQVVVAQFLGTPCCRLI